MPTAEQMKKQVDAATARGATPADVDRLTGRFQAQGDARQTVQQLEAEQRERWPEKYGDHRPESVVAAELQAAKAQQLMEADGTGHFNAGLTDDQKRDFETRRRAAAGKLDQARANDHGRLAAEAALIAVAAEQMMAVDNNATLTHPEFNRLAGLTAKEQAALKAHNDKHPPVTFVEADAAPPVFHDPTAISHDFGGQG